MPRPVFSVLTAISSSIWAKAAEVTEATGLREAKLFIPPQLIECTRVPLRSALYWARQRRERPITEPGPSADMLSTASIKTALETTCLEAYEARPI
jgi:hypothetical protein